VRLPLLGCGLVLFFHAVRVGGETDLVQAPVFTAGAGGYHTYRIPALIVAPKGTLLAFCEGRKKGGSDTGDIDLVLRRSTDGGKTWGPMQVVWDDADNTCGNPCPVVDRTTGTVWLLLTHNLGRDTEAQIVAGTGKGSRTVWICKSTNAGATWTKPVEITKAVKRPDWTWYATGPGVGIQTAAGRLVIPCDNKVAGAGSRQAHVLVSDDHGATWKLGGVVGPDCNECQVAELTDDTLLLNIRSYRGSHRRLIARSTDGGLTWTKPAEDPALIEPICQASLLRVPGPKGPLLFANPASTKREKLTVRLSPDDGKTWPHAKLLHAGPAAYSCLAVLPDGTALCLYERGDRRPYETLTLARFPLRALTTPAASDTHSPGEESCRQGLKPAPWTLKSRKE
jgi:sialidase-1